MLSETMKKLEGELTTLAVTIRHARELEFHGDLHLELARLEFLIYQRRSREIAIRHNYLAVCHRIGIDPHG